MNEPHSTKPSKRTGEGGETIWRRVDAMTGDEIESAAAADPDAQPTDVDFWRTATVIMPRQKVPVSLRLDPEIVAWFKSHGKGYQSRMNAVLRSFMNAHKDQA